MEEAVCIETEPIPDATQTEVPAETIPEEEPAAEAQDASSSTLPIVVAIVAAVAMAASLLVLKTKKK